MKAIIDKVALNRLNLRLYSHPPFFAPTPRVAVVVVVASFPSSPSSPSAMSDEYAQATPAQKLNIATYFIMSSPVGEVDEVVKGQSNTTQAETAEEHTPEAVAEGGG